MTPDDDYVSRAIANVPLLPPVGPHPTITHDCVLKAGNLLKKSSNPGPDGIPSIILRECASSLAAPLSTIFTTSINTGVFPTQWKKSFVFPIHKKGSKLEISNYRGISSLCATSKLLELIVLDFLTHNRQNYIDDTQHGFVKHRSTTTNLLWYSSFLTRTLQERKQVDAIYTDLSAAFDKLDHQIAVAKLERLGFSGSLLNWLSSYLTGRVMTVKIGDELSQPYNINSGVPQGSHLGPFIFLLYVNDVNFLLECLKLSYADDFKLFQIISLKSDTLKLQQQIDIFSDWCKLT